VTDDTVATYDIVHSSRRVPFGGATGLRDFIETGVDWSGAAFVMTLAEAQGGAAVITLTNQTAGTQGMSATYDATYDYIGLDGVATNGPATIIRPQIDETTLEGLTGFPPAPDPYKLVYQLLCTPVGELQRVIYEGAFAINHGVGD
jgi:hypothetical protein